MANLELVIEKSVGWIVFNNVSHGNLLTIGDWRNLPKIIAKLDSDPRIKVIALRGAGGVDFMRDSGAYTWTTLVKDRFSARAYDNLILSTCYALGCTEKPTLAFVNGSCHNGGLAISLFCDLSVAAGNATFAIPSARLGIPYPAAAVKKLVDRIGPSRTNLILFSAGVLSAERAMELGLIDALFDSNFAQQRTNLLLKEICSNSPLSIAAMKKSVAFSCQYSKEAWNSMVDSAEQCYDSLDFQEGKAAYKERRRPKFAGM